MSVEPRVVLMRELEALSMLSIVDLWVLTLYSLNSGPLQAWRHVLHAWYLSLESASFARVVTVFGIRSITVRIVENRYSLNATLLPC